MKEEIRVLCVGEKEEKKIQNYTKNSGSFRNQEPEPSTSKALDELDK